MPRTVSTLSLSDTQRMTEAALGAADTAGLPSCVAVVDAGGQLLSFARQDGAFAGCIDLAIGKARTACLFEKPTEALSRLAQPGAELFGIQNSNSGGIVLIGGGMPVSHNGAIVGAVGASAGTVAQDIAVCEAALDAITRSD